MITSWWELQSTRATSNSGKTLSSTFDEERLRYRQLRKWSRPRRSHTHGDQNGQGQSNTARDGTKEKDMTKVHLIVQRAIIVGNLVTWQKTVGTSRNVKLRLVMTRANLVKEARARATARTTTTKSSQSVSWQQEWSQQQTQGHTQLMSVAEVEEPEKEVRGLFTLCAVERIVNNVVKQICAVEEIGRINNGVDGAAAAVASVGRQRHQAPRVRLRVKTVMILSTKENGFLYLKCWMAPFAVRGCK